ncbi:MAG TPA: DUF3152 domain-containing protein [Acidimicrobiales bacterium]|nr:DUF3152 domain-containing protein [Acidimicrobiales bacterium]
MRAQAWRRWAASIVSVSLALFVPACSADRRPNPTIIETTILETTTRPSAPPTTAPAPPAPVVIAYRLERRTTDDPTADFEATVEATLTDGRGWSRAGFVFEPREDGPYLVVLAEGDEVDRRCRPYDTYGKYSCQNGPTVALNADRWRVATPEWTGELDDYRRMLVNHEVGHLLGMHHPKPQCPAPGRPAPVMSQQSTELDGCLANPWPLDGEIAIAARHDAPLAPGPGG